MGVKMLVSNSIMVVISMCIIPMTYAQFMSSGTASVRPFPFANASCLQYRISHITDTNVAVAGDAVWKGKQTCGTKYCIVCTGSAIEGLPCPCRTGKNVTVTIVDSSCLTSITCSVTGARTYDFILSQEAFLEITWYPSPNITIEYRRVYY